MPDPNNPLSYMSPDELALFLSSMRPQAPAQPPSQTEDPFALLATNSPEQLAQQINLGTLDERGQLLDAQLAAARALQNRATAQRDTVGGTIGSGLGGIVDTVRGGLQERGLREQQQGLLGQKDAGRLANIEALLRFAAQQKQQVPATAGMGDVSLLPPGIG